MDTGLQLKYVQINVHARDWSNSIIFTKHRELLESGNDSWVFWARGGHAQDANMVKIAIFPEVCLDALMTRLDGRPGFYSKGITRRLLNKLDSIDPDVVHLHVLHGYYINIEMLFNWLLNHDCRVVWTLHDCWPITGHCMHFLNAECDQWETGCCLHATCPLQNTYPRTYCKGRERWNYEEKKRIFTSLPAERMKLVVPSKWLKGYVDRSFLSKYETTVVPHKVDQAIFRPRASDFRERHGIGDRFMVLGVASKWGERKGLPIFLKLAELLDSSKYAIVLVGLNGKQLRIARGKAVGLRRVDDASELAKIYSSADVFLNPGTEETFGMNVAEAVACGTRAIVMKGSACAEVADNLIETIPDARAIAREIEKLRIERDSNCSHASIRPGTSA